MKEKRWRGKRRGKKKRRESRSGGLNVQTTFKGSKQLRLSNAVTASRDWGWSQVCKVVSKALLALGSKCSHLTEQKWQQSGLRFTSWPKEQSTMGVCFPQTKIQVISSLPKCALRKGKINASLIVRVGISLPDLKGNPTRYIHLENRNHFLSVFNSPAPGTDYTE